MKSRIILSVLLVLSFGVNAQMEIDKMERLLLDKKDSIGIESYKFLINISGDYNYNSNSVSNSFISSLLYKGDFIDESMKDKASKRLKKYNRLGLEEEISINGVYKTKKLNYVFGAEQRVFGGMHFSDDLFELVFRGNSQFAGKEANFKRSSIKAFDYQSLYFGVQKELNEKYTVGISAALLRGGHYQELKMKNTTMYTAPTGEYVDVDGDISYSRNAPDANKSPIKSNGKGVSFNLYFSMKTEKGRLNAEIRDIGFIAWKNIKTYSGNSFHYDGVLINDILGDGTAGIANTLTLDSIASQAGLDIQTKSKTMTLPAVFHVNYVLSPNKKFSRTIGVRYMTAKGYFPRIYFREADFLGKGFSLVNTVSYGGYGRFDYEIGVLKKFKNSFIISANLFAFEYLVLPGKSSGHGFNMGLTKLF